MKSAARLFVGEHNFRNFCKVSRSLFLQIPAILFPHLLRRWIQRRIRDLSANCRDLTLTLWVRGEWVRDEAFLRLN